MNVVFVRKDDDFCLDGVITNFTCVFVFHGTFVCCVVSCVTDMMKVT